MSDAITIPNDYRAIVMTPPARADSSLMPQLQSYIKQKKLPSFDGHRIVHMHQVEQVDSSAVAAVLNIIQVAEKHGRQFLLCDPPPIVRSYLEIYDSSNATEGRVLSSANDGTYSSDLVDFIPPFVPNPKGRMDLYAEGKVESFEFGPRGLNAIDPVDLGSHPPKVPTRANKMEIESDGTREEVKSNGYVHVRKHNCGCGTTHSTFSKLHQLHGWYRGKGFDFKNVELWASDVPAGMVTEKMTFRDRMHYDQFQTLLKIDKAWQKIDAPMEYLEEEFYYVY